MDKFDNNDDDEKYPIWSDFYDEKRVVKVSKEKFSVFLCHKKKNPNVSRKSILVLIHGGGVTSMSWASCVLELKKVVSICAIDLRGHGESIKTKNDNDLRVDTLSNDVINILSKLYKPDKVKFIVCGHSIGGSIAVHIFKNNTNNRVYLSGVCVIDLVEGSAMDSFNDLKNMIKNRPKKFKSINEAIKFTSKISNISSFEAMKISTPSQLRKKGKGYVWRTNLEKVPQNVWKGWYKGLSNLFLSIKTPKLLIIANMGRLDTPLTIAHMQGKFVLKVVYGSNHFLHEDKPKETSKFITEFINRFSL